mmetsp:Transcript_14637/g.40680  ORF Transcript_14637/g.40680 Transcript_14637/m.40680 type:complete len:682 (+) Transcript_14637:238-2283(+)|eukprot:CAMPEP_0172369874 /NCGR_PEP_ID=MMETSP1060-20121228/35015_1 /TAXON_ID=37318 /ORGANISM="Pseudo-nitzschia pungens, Strain cf. cingulata" /LENGTH=681 /DNA_ID=CAMNT_0013094959 /DNA_START=148 /DNA_END=2193 /DNA_ORIENTATION=+
MSNDGIPGRVGNHQQGNYEAHQLSYFDPGITRGQTISSMSEPGEIDTQSHSLQSTEGSPPPNSATTGSSASASTSLGISDQSQGVTPSKYSASVAEGMITKPFDDTETSQKAISHTDKSVDIRISHTQEPKSSSTSFQSAIKLMVSNNVAGSIIGRAGQTISDLQTQSSARIKLSQTGDYYPGTQDRVCLVQGQHGTVKHAVKLLLERFYMLQEQQHTQHLAWQPRKGANTPSGFDFIVRLLVPSSSCGMIIGKGGANIKHMEETSGVSSVRLSPKEVPDQTAHPSAAMGSGTQERVVTLTGPTLESCISCLYIVIDCMSANHEICRYTNMTTSYSRHVTPPTYTPLQPARPLHAVAQGPGEWDNQGPYGPFLMKRSTSQPDLSHVSIEQRRPQPRVPSESFSGSVSQQQIGQREATVQQFNPPFIDFQQGYNSEMAPMLGTQDRGQRSNNSIPQMYVLGSSAPSQMDHPSMQSSSSAPDLVALQFQDLRISNTQTGQGDYNHFAPQLPQPTQPGFTAQVLVPDNLIGSILGRGGSTLNELQKHSNTRIRISQRGEYVPGTRNRIVTIRGQTAHSVNVAQFLMNQRMVLPPTAGFAGQSAHVTASYIHATQLQPPHAQRIPLHQSTQTVPVDSSSPSTAPQTQQVLHETAFLQPEHHSTAASASSLSLSINTSDNDHKTHR